MIMDSIVIYGCVICIQYGTHWCLAYMTDYFFAGMSTTQRNEDMNRIVKVWINKYFFEGVNKREEGSP